jgi:two-component system, NarL family, sensor histidine kinase UhpB
MGGAYDSPMSVAFLMTRSAPAPLWRDIAIALVAAFLSGWLSAEFELHEAVFNWSRRWEAIQLDEWPVAVFAFAICLVLLYAMRHRQLRAALAENRHLSRQTLAAQEDERRRLARELHDELGQYLNAIQLDARAITAIGGAAPQQEAAARIGGNAAHVYGVVSDLVRRLRPAALDELGLAAALEACVDRARAQYPDLAIRLAFEGGDGLGEALNLDVYRLVQEAVVNCTRHAGSTVLDIGVARSADARSIQVRIADQGVGCDARAALAAGGGLAGMRERVLMQGGQFELLSEPGQGTTINIQLPLGGAA